MFNPLANPLNQSKRSNSPLDIGLARSQDDLQQAFALTYKAYLKAGLVVDNPSGLRLTPYHLLGSSEIVVAKLRGTVVSTISLFGDGELGLPMQKMYPNEIDELRQKGLRLAEIGSLADRRKAPRRFLSTFAEMGRLIGQTAVARNVDAIVAVAHPKHARLYKRVLGFKQVGDHTDCPYANGNPAEALYLQFEHLDPHLRDQFFGNPYAPEQLAPYEWDLSTQKYFRRILRCDATIAHTIGVDGYYDWHNKRIEKPLDVTSQIPTMGQKGPRTGSLTAQSKS